MCAPISWSYLQYLDITTSAQDVHQCVQLKIVSQQRGFNYSKCQSLFWLCFQLQRFLASFPGKSLLYLNYYINTSNFINKGLNSQTLLVTSSDVDIRTSARNSFTLPSMIILLSETDTIPHASWITHNTCKTKQASNMYAETIPALSAILFQCIQKYNENYSNSNALMLTHIDLSLWAFTKMIAYKHKSNGETRTK